jgi:putative Mn2+ efflux pump MntP
MPSNYDHWIAFGLLSLLGFKMAYQSFAKNEENRSFNPFKLIVLIGMAIATSIDALVVGISFAFINLNIYLSILIIGVVTFLVSMSGILFGKKIGGKLGQKMEIIGGLILIGIGVKILLSHLL